VGRLDNIIERNRNPRRAIGYKHLKVGLASLVLFVVLVLLIFTDLAQPSESSMPAPAAGSADKRVHDVLLRRDRVRPSTGSATPGSGSVTTPATDHR